MHGKHFFQITTMDASGNLQTRATGLSAGEVTIRAHCWDEENRLQGSSEKKHAACYLYDVGG